MSIDAASVTVRHQYGRVVRHLGSTRGVEVCALQASPLLGAYLAGLGVENLSRLGLLLLGSTALTAHVFLFNDWVDYSRDTRDLRRASFSVNGISRDHIARVAIALLILANIAFAAAGHVGGALRLRDRQPQRAVFVFAASRQEHAARGIARSPGRRSAPLPAGLLGRSRRGRERRRPQPRLRVGVRRRPSTQEVRDYEFDRANGIRTAAVTFGCRRGFLASFCLFTTAYLLIVGLAAIGVLPKILLASTILWLLQARWSLQALRRGLGYRSGFVDTAPVPVALRIGRSRDAHPLSQALGTPIQTRPVLAFSVSALRSG